MAEFSKPLIPLQPGENYRFHFDATKCIGCKACEVACHEQNNNPPEVKWRQVGEMEGGSFPKTNRSYISMACNHCLNPSCLSGCPVDAYYKDEKTGAVLMKEDACIGCQYCTWNCPYGAPQFNPERGMVTKCDLCHNRLAEGKQSACVEACPSGALTLERFKVDEWKKDFSQANAPGVPDAAITQSTTRITFFKDHQELSRMDDHRLKPEHPHYSLILLTVLTQLAVGGFVSLFILDVLDHFLGFPLFFEKFLKIGRLAMLGTALLALNTSVFHLGRPLYAMRALKMWKRSWLSREVLSFSLFAGSASVYSLLGWQTFWPIPGFLLLTLGVVVTLLGLTGIYCSAMIYRVPARPMWDTWRTPAAFFATAFLLGPLFALVILNWNGLRLSSKLIETFLIFIFLAGGALQIAQIFTKLLYLIGQEELELRQSSRLLIQRFGPLFLSRLGALLAALALVPLALFLFPQLTGWITVLAFMALGSELAGRYLFFVTVVPKKRPEGYF